MRVPLLLTSSVNGMLDVCKCEGKARPVRGFPLRDLGNNPLLQPYLLLSLKHERTRRCQHCATMYGLYKCRLCLQKSRVIKIGVGKDNSASVLRGN